MVLSNGMVLSRRSPTDQPQAQVLAPQNVEVGSYFTPEGKVARVRKSTTDRLYAESFDETALKFVYEKGLVYRLGRRMTLDEAADGELGSATAAFAASGSPTIRSVDRGIGPVCERKI
jgi:hypothetical protein